LVEITGLNRQLFDSYGLSDGEDVILLVAGVPLHWFFLSVFLGLMPYNYLCVTSGVILADIKDVSDILSWTNLGM
jgi:hypothetical protein